MVLNDSVVCSINPSKSSIYYVETKELKHVECPGFGDELAGVYRGEISPDKKQVIFDPVKPENNDGYLDIGVWVLNLGSLEVRQTLPRHPYYRFKNQYPVWSTNSSFVAQWFCLKDSTLLLYEYDLTGKPLRQLTKRSTKFWEVL